MYSAQKSRSLLGYGIFLLTISLFFIQAPGLSATKNSNNTVQQKATANSKTELVNQNGILTPKKDDSFVNKQRHRLNGQIETQTTKDETNNASGVQGIEELNLTHITPDNTWYNIPAWLSGRWSCEEFCQYYFKDFNTNQEDYEARKFPMRYTEIWGLQKDSKGDIWHFTGIAMPIVVESGQQLESRVITTQKLRYFTTDKVVIDREYTTVCLNQSTEKLAFHRKVKCVLAIQKISSTVIRVECSQNIYDLADKLQQTQKAYWLQAKVSDFAPISTIQSRSLFPLFAEYLAYIGKKELIPQE